MESSDNLRDKDAYIKMLRLYKSQPLLWDTSHRLYYNKIERNRAYECILKLYQLIKSKAKLNDVKKKIENMRTSYKKEFRKVKASLESTDGSKHPYKPVLWYYDHMTFLDEKEGASQETNTYGGEATFLNNEVSEEIDQEDGYDENQHDLNMISLNSSNHSYSASTPKSEKMMPNQNTPIDTNRNSLIRRDNHCDTFGIYVGQELGLIKMQQQVIAQKLISDTLFFAKLDLLTPTASVLTTGPTVQLVSSSFMPDPPSNYVKPNE